MTEEPYNKEIYDAIGSMISPIIDKVLQEHSKNLTLVGKSSTEEPQFSYFQPHAYRLCFDFSHQDFNLPNLPPNNPNLGYAMINNGSELFIENYRGCSLRIRKKTITLTNFIEHKRWYAIDDFKAKEQMLTICDFKNKEIVFVLKEFIKEWGGHSDIKLIGKPYADLKLQLNAITEMLEPEQRWVTKKSKKVYYKKQIEVGDIYDAIKLVEGSTVFKYNEVIAEPIVLLANNMALLAKEVKGRIEEEAVKVLAETKQQKHFTYEELIGKGLDEDLAKRYIEFIEEIPDEPTI